MKVEPDSWSAESTTATPIRRNGDKDQVAFYAIALAIEPTF